MKNAARILALVFGLILLGATITNAILIGDSRRALSETVLRDSSAGHLFRHHLMVVIPDTDDSFFQGLLEGIAGQAPMADAAIQVFRYAEGPGDGSDRFFRIALKTKVDGLIMFCQADADIAKLRAISIANNVIFVPVGTDAPVGDSKGFIGSGSLLQGLRGGRLIGASLGNGARVGVILPDAVPGELSESALYRGLVTGLGAWPGARIAAVVRARNGILSGEEATANLLRSGEAVNAIFCSSAQDTEGAAQVLVDMNLVGRIMVVGADETPEIRRFIDKGIIGASIVRDSRRIGQEAVRAFVSVSGSVTVFR